MKYYVTSAGTATYDAIFALAWKRIQALNAARAFVAGVGGVSYRPAKMLWAGGISTVEFTTTPPSGWRRDGSPLANMYRPDSTPEGRALYERIQRLPRVGRNEVNALVGYTDYFAGCRVEVEANVKIVGVKFGFAVSKWMVESGRAKIPADCTEVSKEAYADLTGQNIRLAYKRKNNSRRYESRVDRRCRIRRVFGDDSPCNDNSVGGRTSETFRVA